MISAIDRNIEAMNIETAMFPFLSSSGKRTSGVSQSMILYAMNISTTPIAAYRKFSPIILHSIITSSFDGKQNFFTTHSEEARTTERSHQSATFSSYRKLLILTG